MTTTAFFKWLRDALAHGDGRTIRPLHKPSQREHKSWLAGFEITFPEKKGSKRVLTLGLYHPDMQRIGAVLADAFCRHLPGGMKYFDDDAATHIEETA